MGNEGRREVIRQAAMPGTPLGCVRSALLAIHNHEQRPNRASMSCCSPPTPKNLRNSMSKSRAILDLT